MAASSVTTSTLNLKKLNSKTLFPCLRLALHLQQVPEALDVRRVTVLGPRRHLLYRDNKLQDSDSNSKFET